MYIYHKQCEIMQQNQRNSSNGQLHWFPTDLLWKWSIMDQDYAKTNAFFSVAKFEVTTWKLTSFMLLFFKLGSLLLKVGSNIKIVIGKVAALKKRHNYNFSFQASMWIEHGSHMVLLRSYSYQKSNGKIVAVSFF